MVLREQDTATGSIDGAWCPRTADPMTELHEVIAVLADPAIRRLDHTMAEHDGEVEVSGENRTVRISSRPGIARACKGSRRERLRRRPAAPTADCGPQLQVPYLGIPAQR